jgi:D-glycero-beta-D-manno-heptose 1-phosphate adenylyltransferase
MPNNNTKLNKSLSLKEAINKRQQLEKENKKVIFTNGCFDIIHAGHVTYLQQAKDLGDYLILGINSDSSVQKLKGPNRPIVPQNERITVLSALSMIDMIIIFDESTPIALIKNIQPDVHVKGGDYIKEDLPEYPVIKSYGGEVYILPFVPGASTTNIIEKILINYK